MNVLYRTHTVPTISHTYDTSKQIRDRDGVYVVGRVTFWFDSNRKRVRATTKHDSTIKINYAIDIHMCNVSISAAEQPNIRIISIIKWAFLFSFRSSERMWRQTKKKRMGNILIINNIFFSLDFFCKKSFFLLFFMLLFIAQPVRNLFRYGFCWMCVCDLFTLLRFANRQIMFLCDCFMPFDCFWLIVCLLSVSLALPQAVYVFVCHFAHDPGK